MTELSQISHLLKYGGLCDRAVAWQKLERLEESARSGDEVQSETTTVSLAPISSCTGEQQPRLSSIVLTALGPVQIAQAGLVPLLVALLEQVPCPRRDEVQDQAACLLLEAAASDLGMVQVSST